jgi:hypothetical protein
MVSNQVKLVLIVAAPVVCFAVYISWLIVPQIVRIVVVEVVEKVATR